MKKEILFLKPEKDTYVEFDNKHNVYSDAEELNVDIGRSVAWISFRVPLDGKFVKSARLKLHLLKTSKMKNARICVYALDNYEWDENSFNWYTSSVNGGEWIDTFDVYYKCGVDCDYEANVTNAFRGKNTDTNITFRIDSETYLKDMFTVFSSMESGENSPELIIELTNDQKEAPQVLAGDDGHELWLRYTAAQGSYKRQYEKLFKHVALDIDQKFKASIQYEIKEAAENIFGITPLFTETSGRSFKGIKVSQDLNLEIESFRISSKEDCMEITGNGTGVLYGVFRLMELVQLGRDLDGISIYEKPYFKRRMLNNWEDFDQTVERGYAGGGIWRWHEMPEKMSPVYRDYARIAASIGINSIVINNVNADAAFISDENIIKIARLSDIFREYGIRLYVAVPFDAPVILGGLSTADPEDPDVISYWKKLTDKIYSLIPHFGGYCVKGDSEGQPGPMKYGKDHSVGANMFARILKPYGGIVMWRTFVYRIPGLSCDRACQAYEIFKPLDGKFEQNVILQTKNGPMDFQVYEPVSPLFGALDKTNMGIEFQVIQEYKGHTTHICYLAGELKNILMHETGKGNVASICRELIVSPVNIGTDRNWTRHPLAAANLYSFGRLAFNPLLNVDDITTEWIERTFSSEQSVVETIRNLLLESYDTYASYTSPYGLGYMCDKGAHFHPEPEIRGNYNGNDQTGLGYDRTSITGSGFTKQYSKELEKLYNDPHSIPQDKLLWIHHLPFDFELKENLTLMQAIYNSYYSGVAKVEQFIKRWAGIEPYLDALRYEQVMSKLHMQLEEAIKWRNNSLMFFYHLSKTEDLFGRALEPEKGSISITQDKASDTIYIKTDYKQARIYFVLESYAITARYLIKSRIDLICDGYNGVCVDTHDADGIIKAEMPRKKGRYNIFIYDRNKFFGFYGKYLNN